DELGVVYTPTQFGVEHPDNFPNLDCTIEDPVYLHSPVADVGFRYYSSDNESPVLVSCKTAIAIYEMATVMGDIGGTEFEHIGTYNCRVIGGTETLSEHAFARAIDLYGFLTEDESYYTLEDDWEKFEPNPMTAGGIWLKQLMDTCYEMGVWNIILTPNYNDAHYNHFHVDLTPGSDFYE
ncbi:MAG: extensin family protein, partial [Nannocystaceae bacterium]